MKTQEEQIKYNAKIKRVHKLLDTMLQIRQDIYIRDKGDRDLYPRIKPKGSR